MGNIKCCSHKPVNLMGKFDGQNCSVKTWKAHFFGIGDNHWLDPTLINYQGMHNFLIQSQKSCKNDPSVEFFEFFGVCCPHYGNMVVKFSREGYKIRLIFGQKINTLKENYCIVLYFVKWCSGESSKIGHHLQYKVSQNLKLSKSAFYKKCPSKLIFLNEKNKLKIRFMKVKFWHFLTTRY